MLVSSPFPWLIRRAHLMINVANRRAACCLVNDWSVFQWIEHWPGVHNLAWT